MNKEQRGNSVCGLIILRFQCCSSLSLVNVLMKQFFLFFFWLFLLQLENVNQAGAAGTIRNLYLFYLRLQILPLSRHYTIEKPTHKHTHTHTPLAACCCQCNHGASCLQTQPVLTAPQDTVVKVTLPSSCHFHHLTPLHRNVSSAHIFSFCHSVECAVTP